MEISITLAVAALLAALSHTWTELPKHHRKKNTGENIADAEVSMQTSFVTSTIPFCLGRIAILSANLAPDGAVIKAAAAEPALLRHTGPAIVFDSFDEMNARIDDPSLNVDRRERSGAPERGPQGRAGHARMATLPIPRNLLKAESATWSAFPDAR